MTSRLGYFSHRLYFHPLFLLKSVPHHSTFPFGVSTLFIIFEERYNLRMAYHEYFSQIRESQCHRFRRRNTRCRSIFIIFGAGIIARQLPNVPWPISNEGSECHRNKNKIMISITYMNFPQNTLDSTYSKTFPPIYNYPFVMIKFFPRIIRDQMHIVKEKLRF